MSGFTEVKKQGGTALHAIRRCGPRPARACVVPGRAMTPGAFFITCLAFIPDKMKVGHPNVVPE